MWKVKLGEIYYSYQNTWLHKIKKTDEQDKIWQLSCSILSDLTQKNTFYTSHSWRIWYRISAQANYSNYTFGTTQVLKSNQMWRLTVPHGKIYVINSNKNLSININARVDKTAENLNNRELKQSDSLGHLSRNNTQFEFHRSLQRFRGQSIKKSNSCLSNK